ncbi:MAG: hypothetical protein LBV16_05710 [Elusimicrobiota bacterium]|jgi:hypothetical protein|nr:hypothetical protein [Elusimicrobiota bacterium]
MKKLFLLFLALSIFGTIHVFSKQEATEEEVIEMARNQKGGLYLNKLGDTVEEQIMGGYADKRKMFIEELKKKYPNITTIQGPDGGLIMQDFKKETSDEYTTWLYEMYQSHIVEYRWAAYQNESNKNLWHITLIITNLKFQTDKYEFIIDLFENTMSAVGDDGSAGYLIGAELWWELSAPDKIVDWQKESTVPLQQIKRGQK